MPLTEDKLKQYAIFNGLEPSENAQEQQVSIPEQFNPVANNSRLINQQDKQKQQFKYIGDVQNTWDPLEEPASEPNNYVESYGNGKIQKSISNLKISDGDKKFLLRLAKRESSFNPNAKTKSGTFKGLYQFSNKSLADVGIDMNNYLSDVNIQHEAALRYGNLNLKRLGEYTKYIGSKIKGVLVTREGLMAASHLGGVKHVKDFFDSDGKADFKDANGTPISEYLRIMQ